MFTRLDYSSALEYSIIRRYTNIVYYYYYKKQHTNRQNGPGYGKNKVINEDNIAQVINEGAIWTIIGEYFILFTICVSWKWIR